MNDSYYDESQYDVVWLEEIKKRNRRKKLAEVGCVVVIGALSIATIFGLTNNGTKTINATASEVISVTASSTVFDEYIAMNAQNNPALKTESVDKLEAYINMSERLHSLDLVSLSYGMNELSFEDKMMVSGYDLAKVEELIQQFESISSGDLPEVIQKDQIIRQLAFKEVEINNYIYGVGYDQLEDFILHLVKARICDACGFSVDSIDCLTISSKSTKRTDGSSSISVIYENKEIGKKYTVEISPAEYDLYNVIESLYTIQRNLHAVNVSIDTTYNKDRNDLLLDTINTVKVVMGNEYSIDGIKIDEELNRREVKEKVESLILKPGKNGE